jgi:hypothetical protein
MSDEFRKIPRSYSTELEKAVNTTTNDSSEGILEKDSGGRHSMHFLGMGLVLVLAGIIAVSVLFLKRSSQTTATNTQDTKRPALVVESSLVVENPGKWQGDPPRVVAEKFLAAKTDEERLLWVKDPESVADLVRQFYSEGPGKSLKSLQLTQLPQNVATESSYARFAVRMDDGSARLLCVPYAVNGGGKVDFKCFALYGSETWEDLLSGKATKADEVRVIIERSTYYNGVFSEEEKWQPLVATSPDIEDAIYFYIPREDPAMERLLRDPLKGGARYTLGIQSIGNSHKKRQFVVREVIRPGWLSE